MESIDRDSLVEHVMSHNLFCDAQRGFVQETESVQHYWKVTQLVKRFRVRPETASCV